MCRYSSTTRAPESNLLAALRAAAKPSDRVSPQDLLSRVQHLALPDGCAKGKHDLFEVALVISGAFTPQECEAFIEAARASEDGWHEAQVRVLALCVAVSPGLTQGCVPRVPAGQHWGWTRETNEGRT